MSAGLVPPDQHSDAAESVVVTLSGHHSEQSLVSVLNVLGTTSCTQLRDISQIVVRDRFILTAELVSRGATDVVKDVLFRAHSASLRASFRVGSVQPATEIANGLYVLTVFTQGKTPAMLLSAVVRVCNAHEARINSSRRVTDAADPFTCFEFVVCVGEATLSTLRDALFELGRADSTVDVALQRAGAGRRAKRMAVFDLSWTLVQCDAVDVVLQSAGREAGSRDEGSDDAEWVRKRVRALKGANADVVNRSARGKLIYTHGARELCGGLRKLGCKLAIVSSGSRWVADAAKEALGMHYAFGNVFETDGKQCFTGGVKTPVVDAERKAELVQMLAMQERISVEQMIIVGDGPVSAKMLQLGGLSIAFDQIDSTRDSRSGRIASKSLLSVLYLLGCSGSDLRSVTKAAQST